MIMMMNHDGELWWQWPRLNIMMMTMTIIRYLSLKMMTAKRWSLPAFQKLFYVSFAFSLKHFWLFWVLFGSLCSVWYFLVLFCIGWHACNLWYFWFLWDLLVLVCTVCYLSKRKMYAVELLHNITQLSSHMTKHTQVPRRLCYSPLTMFIAQVVKVVENKVPEKVLCTAEAYPEASFMWRFNDEIIQTQVSNFFYLEMVRALFWARLKIQMKMA